MSNFQKNFGIIVPYFNTKKEQIEQCLCSLIDQNLSLLKEIIVINDGSNKECTDQIISLVDKLNTHTHTGDLIKLIHQENGGSALARKTGILNSSSEILLFVDADDRLRDNKAINKINTYFVSNPNVDVVRFGFVNFDESKEKSNQKIIKHIDKQTKLFRADMNFYLNNANKMDHTIVIGAYAYKRKFLIHERFMNDLKINNEDTYGNAVLGSLNPLIFQTNEIFYEYRINNPNSVTNIAKNNNPVKTLMNHNRGFNEFKNFNINNSQDLRNYGIYGYAQHAINQFNGFRNLIKTCNKHNIICPKLEEFKNFFAVYKPYCGIRKFFIKLCLGNKIFDSTLSRFYAKYGAIK